MDEKKEDLDQGQVCMCTLCKGVFVVAVERLLLSLCNGISIVSKNNE